MQKFKTYLLILLKTLGIYLSTFIIIGVSIYGIYTFIQQKKLKTALELIKEKPVNLPLVENGVQDYLFAAQTWAMPQYSKLLSPMDWLNDYENCIFSTRLNAMKFAGLVPKKYTIKDFVSHFKPNELYGKYGLNIWNNTLDEKTLSEIDARINKNSPYKYKWVSLGSMEELIYLAKRKQHVMVGVTIWQAPNKHRKEPTRYRNSPISHALTITGIKSYDPKDDRIEFEIDDPLPFNWINYIPVYSKLKPNGYNLFKRQAIPFLVKNGKAKSGYVIRELKKENPQNSKISLKNSKTQSRSF